MMAIKKVLVGAKKLPSRKKCCQYYVKTGTFREAVRDFDMMNPDIDSIAKYEVEGVRLFEPRCEKTGLRGF